MNIAKLINFFFLICLAPVLGLAQGFTENVISDASFRGFSVYAADIDGDGDMDVSVASTGHVFKNMDLKDQNYFAGRGPISPRINSTSNLNSLLKT